jgi:hypothetical protein
LLLACSEGIPAQRRLRLRLLEGTTAEEATLLLLRLLLLLLLLTKRRPAKSRLRPKALAGRAAAKCRLRAKRRSSLRLGAKRRLRLLPLPKAA